MPPKRASSSATDAAGRIQTESSYIRDEPAQKAARAGQPQTPGTGRATRSQGSVNVDPSDYTAVTSRTVVNPRISRSPSVASQHTTRDPRSLRHTSAASENDIGRGKGQVVEAIEHQSLFSDIMEEDTDADVDSGNDAEDNNEAGDEASVSYSAESEGTHEGGDSSEATSAGAVTNPIPLFARPSPGRSSPNGENAPFGARLSPPRPGPSHKLILATDIPIDPRSPTGSMGKRSRKPIPSIPLSAVGVAQLGSRRPYRAVGPSDPDSPSESDDDPAQRNQAPTLPSFLRIFGKQVKHGFRYLGSRRAMIAAPFALHLLLKQLCSAGPICERNSPVLVMLKAIESYPVSYACLWTVNLLTICGIYDTFEGIFLVAKGVGERAGRRTIPVDNMWHWLREAPGNWYTDYLDPTVMETGDKVVQPLLMLTFTFLLQDSLENWMLTEWSVPGQLALASLLLHLIKWLCQAFVISRGPVPALLHVKRIAVIASLALLTVAAVFSYWSDLSHGIKFDYLAAQAYWDSG